MTVDIILNLITNDLLFDIPAAISPERYFNSNDYRD